jgi:hypothetical protein
MQLVLIDDETVALLRTETIEADLLPAIAARHPGEVRANGTGVAATGQDRQQRTLGEGRAGRDNLAILDQAKEIPVSVRGICVTC